MYKTISDTGDYTTLQSDINSVADWINEHYTSHSTIEMQMYDCDRASQ